MSPSHSDVPHGDCLAAREVRSRVGDKWGVFVIGLLGDGPKRFSEIEHTIEGISQRMLTLTLRALERDALVMRTVFPTIPPRVDYALTPLGFSLPTGQERARESCPTRRSSSSLGALCERSREHRHDTRSARNVRTSGEKRRSPLGSLLGGFCLPTLAVGWRREKNGSAFGAAR